MFYEKFSYYLEQCFCPILDSSGCDCCQERSDGQHWQGRDADPGQSKETLPGDGCWRTEDWDVERAVGTMKNSQRVFLWQPLVERWMEDTGLQRHISALDTHITGQQQWIMSLGCQDHYLGDHGQLLQHWGDVGGGDCGQDEGRDQAGLLGMILARMAAPDWSVRSHVIHCDALIGQRVSWLRTHAHQQYSLPPSFQHRSEYLHTMATLASFLFIDIASQRNILFSTRTFSLVAYHDLFEHVELNPRLYQEASDRKNKSRVLVLKRKYFRPEKYLQCRKYFVTSECW